MSNNLSFIPDEKFIDHEDETNFIGHEYALNYNAKIMPCTQSLIEFLDKDNELARPKNHKETNIIDLQRGKCYSFNKNSDELDRISIFSHSSIFVPIKDIILSSHLFYYIF